MSIENLINWCNNNEGFATILLSFFTLIVSIIAIIVSINTARLPYKKRLLLVVGSYIGIVIDTIGIHVTATNIGNRIIKIKNMALLINRQCFTNINTINESQIQLNVGESTSQYFENNDLNTIKKLNGFFKVYGYVEDSEGRKYKKYLCRVRKLNT